MISQDMSEFALHARAILGMPIPEIRFYGPSASKAIVVEGNTKEYEFCNLDKVLEEALAKAERAYAKLEVKVY